MSNQVSNPPFSGVFPALVTPFTPSGDGVDYDSLGHLLQLQLGAKVHGVVVCGSTGEAATLTDDEYFSVISYVRKVTTGIVPCIAGISVSSTAKAVQLAKFAATTKCDGILVASPPYNKPTQPGLIEHFRAIYQTSRLPIIAYNIPGRSGVSILPPTLSTLASEGTIVGVKESSGSFDTVIDVLRCVPHTCGVLSGEDSFTLATLVHGGSGVISASANVFPDEFVSLYTAFQQKDFEQACNLQMGMMARIRANFVESNPAPVKEILASNGVIRSAAVRLPLVPLQPESLSILKAAYQTDRAKAA